MIYKTYGLRTDAKGNSGFGPEHIGTSRREAAIQRNAVCSEKEMNGKDRTYARAITYVSGHVYKIQDFSSPVSK